MSQFTQTIAAPNKDNATTSQISNLLQIVGVLTACMTAAEDYQGGKLDGGTKAAISGTIIEVCNRLGQMMGEKSRWDIGEYVGLTNEMKKMYEENTKLIVAQRAAYEDATSPHARYKPSLVKLGNGKWLAIAGDLGNIDNALVGIGDYPEQAVEQFDALFKGKVTPELAKFLADNQTQNENTSKMDTLGTGNTQEPEKPRRKRRGHSGTTGQEPPFSDGTGLDEGH